MTLDLEKHPCFNEKVRQTHGRIHLPVAPRCNIQCRFCSREFDCANESRPGVTSVVLTPVQALTYLDRALTADPRLSVVGIAGPGDPFANPDETMTTLRLIRHAHPDILLCVATNGLAVGPYIDELAALKVGHVTITINAVDPAIGERIYAWMRYGKRVHRAREAAEHLLQCQLDAVRRLAALGVTVKVNTILIPGINDEHIEAVAEKVASLGAAIFNCIPLYPVEGTEFASIQPPSAEQTAEARDTAQHHLPQMRHCGRCRADAVGLIGELMPEVMQQAIHAAAEDRLPVPSTEMDTPGSEEERRPYVAVASREGVLVNQHLGEAEALSIYQEDETSETGYELVEIRTTPPVGGGDSRWQALATLLADCRALLVAGAGPKPTKTLTAARIRVGVMEGLITDGLNAVYAGNPLRSPGRCGKTCGSGCAGTATGCG